MSGSAGTKLPGDVDGWRGRFGRLRRLAGVMCFGYDAFISHAHEGGRDYAFALWTALEDVGLTVCLDQRDFEVGDPLGPKMKGTVKASRALVLLDTIQARNSEYVAEEIRTAIRKRRRIVTIHSVGAASQGWRHLSAEHRDAIEGLIHEPTEGIAVGTVRFETVARIRRSLSTWTTRRRLVRSAVAVACLAVLGAAAATVASLAAARVKALRWTLEDRSTSQRQAVADVGAFVAGPLFTVADFLYPDEADQLLNQAVQASIKATRLDVPGGHAVVSPFGGALVVDHGQTFDVRTPGGSTTCETGRSDAAVGVDDAGTVLVAATGAAVFSWRVSGCQPMVSGDSWRGPDGGSDPPLGVQVFPAESASANGALEHDVLVWSSRELVRLRLTPTGATASARFAAAADDAMPRLFHVMASAGSWVTVLAGSSTAFKEDRLCVLPWTLDGSPSCTTNVLVSHLALDPGGRYLIVGAEDRTLRQYDLSKPNALDEPSVLRVMSVRALASAGTGNVFLALDTDGVLSLVDLPSLTTLARRAGYERRDAMLLGEFRRPVYAASAAALVNQPPVVAPAFASTECAGRQGPIVAEVTSGEGLVVRDGAATWALPLTGIGVSRQAQVATAAFAAGCDRLVVATTEGETSELVVVDVAGRGRWSKPALRRRTTRATMGTITGMDLKSFATGWIDATLDTGGDGASQVTTRVPVARSTVVSALRGDPSAHDGRVAMSAR